jgi:hypothetical protein
VETEARALGRGGITRVAQATGIATSTITRGLSELRSRARVAAGRVRRPGGGRKRTIDKDPTLLRDLEGLVEPTTSGDPDSPLRWTAKTCGNWPGHYRPWATASVANWWPSC